MCFSDIAPRMVCEVAFDGRTPAVTQIPVPQFADIRRLRGSWESLEPELERIAESDREILCEVIADDLAGAGLVNRMDALFQGRMKNYPLIVRSSLPAVRRSESFTPERVAEMKESEVFELLLKRREVPEEDAAELRELYRQTVLAVKEAEET